MKSTLIAASVLLTVSFLASATSKGGNSNLSPVPSSAYVGSVPTPSSEMPVTILARREKGGMGGMVGWSLRSTLVVDGVPITPIKAGEYVELKMEPGDHGFGVTWSDGVGKLATGSEVFIDAKPGVTYYLRMFPKAGSGIVIERSSK